MHRSGTSLLAGVLALCAQFVVGSKQDLIGARSANVRGYFERHDVVIQNEEWLHRNGLTPFHHVKRLQELYSRVTNISSATTEFALGSNGTQALQFLLQDRQPWLVKDPRLSLTLPLWIQHFQEHTVSVPLPAVVLIYRHPIQVAWSMHHRDNNCEYDRALGLWLIYNEMAIRHSNYLCRVVVSHRDLVTQPHRTAQYIVKQLVQKCHVQEPPVSSLPGKVIHAFVDKHSNNVPLQEQNRIQDLLPQCDLDYNNLRRHLPIDWEALNFTQVDKKRVRMAMKLYCDMRNGRAFEPTYDAWASLQAA
jgi:hypothetical protein